MDRGLRVALRNLHLLIPVVLLFAGLYAAHVKLYIRVWPDFREPAGVVIFLLVNWILFYAIPSIADVGGWMGTVIATSWHLLRLTARDVGLAVIGFLLPGLLVATVPVFVLQAVLDIQDDPFISTPGEILFAFGMAPVSAFYVAYMARLYLFAQSVKAGAERRERAAR